MPKIKITERKLKQYIDDGIKPSEIARLENVSKQAVYSRMKYKKTNQSTEEKLDIVNKHYPGCSIKELSLKLGYKNIISAYQFLHRHGIEVEKTSLETKSLRKIHELAKKGMSRKQISDELNISYSYTCRIIRNNEINIRRGRKDDNR